LFVRNVVVRHSDILSAWLQVDLSDYFYACDYADRMSECRITALLKAS